MCVCVAMNVLSTTRLDNHDDKHDDDEPHDAARAAALGRGIVILWVIVPSVDWVGSRIRIDGAMGNQDLSWTAVVVRTDDTTLFKLADELGSSLVADVEVVA